MAPASNARAALISEIGRGILPIGSVGIAMINMWIESTNWADIVQRYVPNEK
jgi:hypothetical protein